MDKKIYVSDGEYFLVPVTEEEKDNYMKVMFPENDTPSFYRHEENRELFWKIIHTLDEKDFSIYNREGKYCGNIELKQCGTATPEIGIELLENQRNKGIAGRAIKMLARKYYEESEGIENFVLRVSSDNSHSRHMIEKLGAEFVCEEETSIQRTLRLLKEQLGEEAILKTEEEYKAEYGLSEEEKEKVVYRYRLMPEVFL